MVEETREYRIHEPIGRGGFGTVYRAELIAPGGFRKPVAVKVLNADVNGMDEVVQRLRDEARMLALVRHSGIIHVDGLFQLQGRWAVVMEHFAGVGLNELLARAELPARCAVEIVGRVADALHAAHSASDDDRPLNLIHRDVKPSNILIGASGEVKIFDFGVARADLDSREAETRALFLGTPEYMAPERWLLQDSQAVDVYSLGTVLLEALTGERLGQTVPEATKHRQLVDDALGALPADLPESISELLCLMLAFEPGKRPSAREVERRCRELLSSLPGPWLRDWAEQAVPAVTALRSPISKDPLSGTTMLQAANDMDAPTELSPSSGQAIVREEPDPNVRSARIEPSSATKPRSQVIRVVLTLAALGLVVVGLQQLWSSPPPSPHSVPSDQAAPLAPTPEATPARPAGDQLQAAPLEPEPPPTASTAPTTPAPLASSRPRPTPAPEPAANPNEPPSPEPSERSVTALPEPGMIVFEGDAVSVQLRSATGVYAPGEVPPGTYTIVASFEGRGASDAGQVTVESGETATLVCNSTFAMCRSTP